VTETEKSVLTTNAVRGSALRADMLHASAHIFADQTSETLP